MDDLIHLVGGQFRSRADVLKASSALAALRALLAERPPAAASLIERSIERLESNAHELRELALLSAARTTGLGLSPAESEEAERLIGAAGTAPADRLGLPEDAAPEDVHRAAVAALHRWRALAGSPLLDRGAAEACDVVTRSCEALVVAAGPASVERRRLHLAPSAEPSVGGGEEAGDPGRDREAEAAEEQHLDEEAELRDGEERAADERRTGVHQE
jgi:hypothetical protein